MGALFLIAVGYVIGVLFPSPWLKENLVNLKDKFVGLFKDNSNKS